MPASVASLILPKASHVDQAIDNPLPDDAGQHASSQPLSEIAPSWSVVYEVRGSRPAPMTPAASSVDQLGRSARTHDNRSESTAMRDGEFQVIPRGTEVDPPGLENHPLG